MKLALVLTEEETNQYETNDPATINSIVECLEVYGSIKVIGTYGETLLVVDSPELGK